MSLARQPDCTDLPARVGVSADERLARELAAIQARADLEVAKRAASLLGADGLRELRAWIDSRLADVGESA